MVVSAVICALLGATADHLLFKGPGVPLGALVLAGIGIHLGKQKAFLLTFHP